MDREHCALCAVLCSVARRRHFSRKKAVATESRREGLATEQAYFQPLLFIGKIGYKASRIRWKKGQRAMEREHCALCAVLCSVLRRRHFFIYSMLMIHCPVFLEPSRSSTPISLSASISLFIVLEFTPIFFAISSIDTFLLSAMIETICIARSIFF